jgi:hypothetical protein
MLTCPPTRACCREGCTPAEFEGLVQRNVAANAGLGFAGLADLAATIARRELRRMAGCVETPGAGDSAAPVAGHVSAGGCGRCAEAEAEAAASAAEALAACCERAGGEAATQLPHTQIQQLHCVFNLRRALFVLEALEGHDRNVLGIAAAASPYASDLRHMRLMLHRFDQTVASR